MLPFKRLLSVIALVSSLGSIAPCSQAQAGPYDEPSSSVQVFSQEEKTAPRMEYNPLLGPDYPLEPNNYFTDDSGNILMIVNVLGAVNRPGQIIVRENADFATVLAMAGGPTEEANLKKVLVARQDPDTNGKMAYKIDLKKYYKNGDRSDFISLRPNDTIIVDENNGLTLKNMALVSGIALGAFSIISLF